MGQEKVLRSFLDEMVVLQGGKRMIFGVCLILCYSLLWTRKKGFINLFLEYKKKRQMQYIYLLFFRRV